MWIKVSIASANIKNGKIIDKDMVHMSMPLTSEELMIANDKTWANIHEHGCNCQIYFTYYTYKILDLIFHFLNDLV